VHEPITTLVFDLDGTLYANQEFGREINHVACLCLAGLKGIEADEAAALIRETKARLSAESGFDTPLSLATSALGVDIVELHRRFAAAVEPERFLVRDERVVDLLRHLSGGFSLYVYTNNNLSLADRIMRLLGIDGFFRKVFSIEYSWRPKPHQETLTRLLQEIGKRPSECLFVGDRYDVDLRLPAAMGCGVFRVGGVEELLQLCTLMSEENL
jgi:putative hydrolase of the HAD superfamily